MRDLFGRRFAALLFDMDGTLIDSMAVALRVWRRWAEDNGIPAEPLLATIHGVRAIETVKRWATPGMDIAREADVVTEAEMADVDGIVPIAGVAEFLVMLPKERWAIVTSAPRRLAERRLAAAGIASPPLLVSAEDVEYGKPAPDCYLAAAERLGVEAADCLVFEDASAGIAAGEAAGAAILVVVETHDHPIATAHPTVQDYCGLVAKIDRDGIAIGMG